MALDNYANFVRGSLTAAVDNSQTTVPVNNASIFPDPATGNYNLVVWDVGSHPRPDQDPDVEVMRVTGRDTGTDELTVTRGQEATTGVSHPDGSALHLSYTAKLAADIETDYVAEGENFDGQGTSEFTNLQSVNTTEELNNVVYVDRGDDPQPIIDDAFNGDARQTQIVRFRPMPGTGFYDLENASLPLELPPGMTLDLRRTFFNLGTNFAADSLFSLTQWNDVLTHGMRFWAGSYEDGAVFLIDADRGSIDVQKGVKIHGYGNIRITGDNQAALAARQTTGNIIVGCSTELSVENSIGASDTLLVESTGSGGFISDNDFRFYGVCGGSGSRFAAIRGPGAGVSFNRVYGEQVQFKGGTPHIGYFEDCSQNLVYMGGADLFNGQAEWTVNSGPANRILCPNVYGDGSVTTTDNSGSLGNFVASDLPLAVEKIDPSGNEGPWDGYTVRLTGTSGTEDTLAVWSDNQSAWVKQEDGTTFT